MKASDVLIIIIWVYFITNAFFQGLGVQDTHASRVVLLTGNIAVYLIFPFIFLLWMGFSQRGSVFEIPIIGPYVDTKYGDGAHREFMIKLKPVLLFTLFSGILGLTGLIGTYISTQTVQGYVVSAFFLSGFFGLGLAYMLSFRFPPKLY